MLASSGAYLVSAQDRGRMDELRRLAESLQPVGTGTPPDPGVNGLQLSAEYGLYLRTLFPRARFLFLVRDPRDGYRAYRERTVLSGRWPHSQLRAPYIYGQVWRRQAQSFLDHRQRLDASVLRFEDLLDGGPTLSRLEQLLGREIDRSVLVSDDRDRAAGRPSEPTALELATLDFATQPVAATLGYRPAT